MKKIINYDQLYKLLNSKQKVFIYVSSKLCNDCTITSYIIQKLDSSITKDIYEIEYCEFELFCSEFQILKIPSILKFNKFELQSKIGTGQVLTKQEILNYIND